MYLVRDLDLWGQPSFLIFQPCFHRCARCGHRQEHFAPFKRKKVMYTYRFELPVLKDLYDVRVRFKEIFACGV